MRLLALLARIATPTLLLTSSALGSVMDFEVLRHDDATLQSVGDAGPDAALYAEDGFVVQGTSFVTIGTLLDGSGPFPGCQSLLLRFNGLTELHA